MLYIDNKPVPFDPMTGEPLANVQLVNGQWLLAANIGKDVMPEYRVIPESLLRDAVLFEDKATKRKVGYVDANRLAAHLKQYEAPKGAGFAQFKKDIAKAANQITTEWNAYVQASNQRGLMPEVTRRGQEIEARLANLGGSPLPDNRYIPLTQNGTVKQSSIKPATSAKPDATLADTSLPVQGPGVGGRDALSNPWSALTGLDFSEPGIVFDASDNPMLILLDSKNGNKAYAVSQTEFTSQVTNMPKQLIAQYQAALKKAGQWSGTVDGELNYLNRSEFANKLLLAAQGATQENLAAYTNKSNKVKGIFDVINEAARVGGETKTTAQTYITNRETAQQILDDTYLQSIGRKANKKEVDEFYQKVQKEAKARPTVTTRGTGSVSTKAGFTETSVVDMAGAQAEARPEFLAYQLSTNFYNALLGASRLPMEFGAGEAPTTGPLG